MPVRLDWHGRLERHHRLEWRCRLEQRRLNRDRFGLRLKLSRCRSGRCRLGGRRPSVVGLGYFGDRPDHPLDLGDTADAKPRPAHLQLRDTTRRHRELLLHRATLANQLDRLRRHGDTCQSSTGVRPHTGAVGVDREAHAHSLLQRRLGHHVLRVKKDHTPFVHQCVLYGLIGYNPPEGPVPVDDGTRASTTMARNPGPCSRGRHG
mmetsp:Transcript_7111/g.15339  ORF Transcript_7111/g.15339 Transcript_7111/m.15339 type:complete len:206 (+) Transcript_7111:862-1479(+)